MLQLSLVSVTFHNLITPYRNCDPDIIGTSEAAERSPIKEEGSTWPLDTRFLTCVVIKFLGYI
jgi:hypothetical protein